MTDVPVKEMVLQHLGSLVGIMAIIVTCVFYSLQRRRKALAYDVLSSSPLVTNEGELQGQLKVLFKDTEVENVNLFVLQVTNNGNVPITESDFSRPLSFQFGDNANVLTAEITETSPENLVVVPRIESNLIHIDPLLLNGKDSFTLRTLVGNYSGPIVPDARVVGVSSVTFLPNRLILQVLPLAVGGTVLMICAGLLKWLDLIGEGEMVGLAMLGYMLLVLGPFTQRTFRNKFPRALSLLLNRILLKR